MSPREGAPDHLHAFFSHQCILLQERSEELVLCAHGAVEHAEGFLEGFPVIQERQMMIVPAVQRAQETAEYPGIAKKLGMR